MTEKCKLVTEKLKLVNLVCPRRLAKAENRAKKKPKNVEKGYNFGPGKGLRGFKYLRTKSL